MNEVPCQHLLEDDVHCELGWTPWLDCLGCKSYRPKQDPQESHQVAWDEIRNKLSTETK